MYDGCIKPQLRRRGRTKKKLSPPAEPCSVHEGREKSNRECKCERRVRVAQTLFYYPIDPMHYVWMKAMIRALMEQNRANKETMPPRRK